MRLGCNLAYPDVYVEGRSSSIRVRARIIVNIPPSDSPPSRLSQACRSHAHEHTKYRLCMTMGSSLYTLDMLIYMMYQHGTTQNAR
jgi:hypothetical protein